MGAFRMLWYRDMAFPLCTIVPLALSVFWGSGEGYAVHGNVFGPSPLYNVVKLLWCTGRLDTNHRAIRQVLGN